MPSSNKTEPYGLNIWSGRDKPKADDFTSDNQKINEALSVHAQITNRTYPGVDLTAKFAAEIAAAPYNGDPWAWIKARIQAVNFAGIYNGDYIPWQSTNGYKVKSEIAGIDTYYNYGDTSVGHHIDFISRDCWPQTIPFNLVDNNNGTAISPYPWLASNLYAKLNSLQMQVPNSAANNTTLTTVDYRTTGVYDKLPAALKNVISPKRVLLPQRYTAGLLLATDNSWGWGDAGKLWIPSEREIYGCEHWGSKNGHSSGGFQQYPIFATNMKSIKGAGDGGGRSYWWSLSANGDSSALCASVGGDGIAHHANASNTGIRVPVCFRIENK